jgi:hypothetical protein
LQERQRAANRGRLRHRCREFNDSHLSIAGPEIGDQDLIRARVKGAAATAGTVSACGTAAATAAAIAATAPRAVQTDAPSAPAAAEAAARGASCEIRECAAAGAAARQGVGIAGAEKPAATAATTHGHAGATPVAAGSAITVLSGAAVRASETALAGKPHAGRKEAATAATTSYDQRRVAWADHKTPTATAAVIAARTADGDL